MQRTSWSLVLVAVLGCGNAREKRGDEVRRKEPATVTVTAQPSARTLSFTGTIVARRDATVSSSRGGRVEAYAFDIGENVRAGDLVVRLGAEELVYASRAAAAGARLASVRLGMAKDAASLPGALSARAALETATDAVRRAERLHAEGSTSEQELARVRSAETTAKASYAAALAEAQAEFARVREAEALAGQANAALGDKDIRAPFGGVVLERFVEVGQLAAPNAPLVRIVDPAELRVRFDVPQVDAAKVALGRSVRVLVEGTMRNAHVVRSSPGLVGEAGARRVEAVLPAEPVNALPGARVPVWLEVGEDEELVVIPASATTSTAGIVRAWVVEDARLVERLIGVARIDGDRVFVRSGLRAGERLVKSPQRDFRIGEQVAP